MAVVEYSRQNWFERIGGAIKGVLIGVILFVIAFPVLFLNEGRAVHTARRLAEGAAAVVPTDSAAANPANDGKLIHFTGNAAVADKLTDPQFGVSLDAVHLRRVAEMYQWKENKKEETRKDTVGGGETRKTTYSYEKVWQDKPIDSSDFKERGHGNPAAMRFSTQTWDADKVRVGAFALSPGLVSDIDNYTDVPADDKAVAALPDEVKANAVVSDGRVYIGDDAKPSPTSPKIGDLRVTFQGVKPGPVSVIAMQAPGGSASTSASAGTSPGAEGHALSAFPTKNGPLQLLHVGTHGAEEMFQAEQSKNSVLTWILRLVGFFLMWIGMMLVLNPLKVVADVIGFVGDIAGVGIGLVTLVAALCLSFVTIALAWIAYRPLVGIGLLAVAGGAAALFVVLRRRGAARRAAGFTPAGVVPPAPAYAGPPAQ